MKLSIFLAFACALTAWAQQKPASGLAAAPWASLPDDAEIARIDGVPLTMGAFKAFTSLIDPSNQAKMMVDPGEVVRQMALMHKLADIAAQQKLDKESPTREQLEYNRLVILSQAAVLSLVNNPTVDQKEILAYYNVNKESFKQVKVKAIYIAFSATPTNAGGKKSLSEADAKAKATKVLASIKGGADFVKLVKENSDDETSKARDGDFATVTPSDNIPDAMRAAVFQLKQGETSEPVRQSNGYYLLKADQVTYLALSSVKDQIFSKLKDQKGMETVDKIRRDLNVQFTNPAFPGKPAASK